MFGYSAWLSAIILMGPPSALAALVSVVLAKRLQWSFFWVFPFYLVLLLLFLVGWVCALDFVIRFKTPPNDQGGAENKNKTDAT